MKKLSVYLLMLQISVLFAQQFQTVLTLPWSADDSPAYSVLPEGRYGPQAFSVINNKIYLLDNQNKRLNIYQGDQLIENYLIPEGCYNLTISEQNIFVNSGANIWSVDENSFKLVYQSQSKQPITKLFTSNNKHFFQLSNKKTIELNKEKNSALLKPTETDPIFYTEKINNNLARIFYNNNGREIEFEINFPESDLASIRFLEIDNKNQLYFVIERFKTHAPLQLNREIHQYNFQGNLINRIEIPANGFMLCANDISVSKDSQVYFLYTTSENLQILRWDLSRQYDKDLQFLPSPAVDQRKTEIFPEKESKENSLLKLTDLPEVSPDQALITGDSYVQLTWSCNGDNLTNGLITDSYGYKVRTPSWVTPGTHQNVVYKWGGFETLEQFLNGLNNDKYAGDSYTDKGTGTPSAVGVDCSGFVSRCWNLPSHYSTRMMDDAITLPYDNWEQTKPGDAAHKVGHVRLIVEHNPDGTITMVESAGYNWRVSYRAYSYAELYNYTPRYYINMQGTPGNIPQPVLAFVKNNKFIRNIRIKTF